MELLNGVLIDLMRGWNVQNVMRNIENVGSFVREWKREGVRTLQEGNAVFALDGFWQEPVRSSETRGRSSKQASVYEERCQKPVRSSEQWVGLSEQASGCCRSSE